MYSLDIIIVNWNSGYFLESCIKSILDSDYSTFKLNIYVVDNNSSDNSIQFLKSFDNINLIMNPLNKGFGAACNQALTKCNSDFVLLLNPDTEIYKNTLPACINLMANNSDYSIVGLKQVRKDGSILKSCSRFINLRLLFNQISGLSFLFPEIFKQNIMSEWDHNTSKVVDHVMGSFMFIRKSSLDLVGNFDEKFFVYLEDIDLSKRMSRANGIVYFSAENSILHEGGGTSSQVIAKRIFYSLHSRIIYINKYFNLIDKFFAFSLMIFIEPFTRIIFLFLKGNFIGIGQTIKSYQMLLNQLLFNSYFNFE